MLHLKDDRCVEMETLGFAPCPTIDLMWHTHLLFPSAYRRDMMAQLGHVPAHKLLAAEDRTRVCIHERDVREEAMWQETFSESLFAYGFGASA
jgi:hypothetical protein